MGKKTTKFKESIYSYFGNKTILKHACFLTEVNPVEDTTILFSNHLREQYIAIIDINVITVTNFRDFFNVKVVGHLVSRNLHSVTLLVQRLYLSVRNKKKIGEENVDMNSFICNVELKKDYRSLMLSL